MDLILPSGLRGEFYNFIAMDHFLQAPASPCGYDPSAMFFVGVKRTVKQRTTYYKENKLRFLIAQISKNRDVMVGIMVGTGEPNTLRRPTAIRLCHLVQVMASVSLLHLGHSFYLYLTAPF
ncbi:MAG: hypothetical protein MI725_17925 [Pirellulales bacterium]|nr:hypothetical protein [Pirellulales bacterium]